MSGSPGTATLSCALAEDRLVGLACDVAAYGLMPAAMHGKTLSRSLGSAVVLLAAGAAATQEPALKPVATVTQLMRAMVIPSSNALFDVPRNPPTDESGWDGIKNHAVILAESGNLLLIGKRAEDSDVWVSTSLALAAAGKAALEAADARDVDAITDVGNQIIEACESCHEKHWVR